MTIKELQRRRRNGASLKILADLAGCTITEIEEALAHSDGSYVADASDVSGKVNYTFDTEKAMALYEEGYNDQEIGERVGISGSRICVWRKNEGLPTKHGRRVRRLDRTAIEALHREGLRPTDICRRLDISRMTYYRWKDENGIPNRPKWDQQKALELYKSGLVDREVAERVGISSETIGNWRREKGLSANGRRRVSR